MNYFFLSDDKFAEIFGVAVYSLFEQHKHVDDLRVFLIENNVKEASKEKLRTIAKEFEREIECR